MTEFFNRKCSLQVGTSLITDLRITFKIEKTLKKDPNTLDVSVFNLSEDSRKKLQSQSAFVKLIAGYEGEEELLFTGDAINIDHKKEGADWITRLRSFDGSKKRRTKRVSESFKKGTSVKDVIKKVADATGFGIGNLVDEIKAGNLRNGLENFANGFVSSGVAADELDGLMKTYGYDWSVQDGNIQVIKPLGVVGTDVVLLNKDSGLIGSPEAGEKGIIKAKCLIRQRLLPGRKLKLTNASFDGFYRIEKTEFNGDTRGQDWYADLELKPFSA